MHDSYEAVTVGETLEVGSTEITREEIIDFAESYDPQSFHLDDDPDGPFEGVIASGWHTAAVTMGLVVEGYLQDAAAVGSPGLDGLRWREPVRPGDTLSATITFAEKEPWDEERGLVHQEVEAYNQRDATVMWMDALTLYRREG
jgi:acyl dehydratase